MEDKKCGSKKDNVNIHYDEQWGSYSEQDILKRVENLAPVLDSIISLANLKTGSKILDLGSGPAVIPLRIRKDHDVDCEIHGIDISKSAIFSGKEVLKHSNMENVHLVLGDCENLPYREFEFDAVISNATFNLLLDKKKGFSEMTRVLKDHGRLVIGDCIAREKKCQKDKDDRLWSQCIAGAPTHKEMLEYAESEDLHLMETFNLTQKVRELVTHGLWDWPEFVDHDLDYYVFEFRLGLYA
jgi:ubiquinone/menaquinone biosynthesis C-methylase UbiE